MFTLPPLCSEGKVDEVRAALARGEDVNSKHEDNSTGLMWALIHNHNLIVRLLLEQPTVDLNCTDNERQTAVHYAADGDNVEGVRLLLADPRLDTANHEDDEGFTPVMAAVFCNKVNALRELVAHPSVLLDVRDRDGMSLEDVARLFFAVNTK